MAAATAPSGCERYREGGGEAPENPRGHALSWPRPRGDHALLDHALFSPQGAGLGRGRERMRGAGRGRGQRGPRLVRGAP